MCGQLESTRSITQGQAARALGNSIQPDVAAGCEGWKEHGSLIAELCHRVRTVRVNSQCCGRRRLYVASRRAKRKRRTLGLASGWGTGTGAGTDFHHSAMPARCGPSSKEEREEGYKAIPNKSRRILIFIFFFFSFFLASVCTSLSNSRLSLLGAPWAALLQIHFRLISSKVQICQGFPDLTPLGKGRGVIAELHQFLGRRSVLS